MPYFIEGENGELVEVTYRQWQEIESPGNPMNLCRCDPIQDDVGDDDPYRGREVIEHDFTCE